MPHPSDGALRRLLDEPAGVSQADRQHVAGCDTCLTGLIAVRADADGAASLLAAPAHDADVDAAWRRLSASVAAQAPARATAPRREGRLRELLKRPAAGALAVSLVLAGAGTAAANDWLPVFRTERVAPVSLSTGDLLALPDLSEYGDLELSAEPAVRSVPDAGRAEDETGLDVPQVGELPAGISGEPIHQLVRPVTATFTFSAERAARAAAASGQRLPALPPGLDGTAVRLEAGPGVAQVWTSSSGAPALLVARAQAPTAFSSGAPFEVVRDYLLSLPGLPDDVARQLRTYAADGSTLPLPVPEQYATTSSTDVGGVPATVLQTRDGVLSAVVWVDDGVVSIVAGSLSEDEVVAVAPGTAVIAPAGLEQARRLVADLPPPAAVWCSGLRKRYGRQVAVEDVSLEVGRGEVVGLLGPNGAGKTTVIKVLLGLVRPDAGEVLLLGQPATDPTARARVGYLPELFRYQPWLTPAEVLQLHVRLAGLDVPAAERRDALALVGLDERGDDRLGGFSKGMQQRLGLAVALVARPELVVLDEPTSALDPLGRVDVRDVVLSLKARGVAVLLNSHLIGEVERVCDRVVILDRGRVAASGSLSELLGLRELRLHLTGVTAAVHARLVATGRAEREGEWYTVALPADDLGTAVPDLVDDLVRLGARVHAVEPGRISLEERLLGILRDGADARAAAVAR